MDNKLCIPGLLLSQKMLCKEFRKSAIKLFAVALTPKLCTDFLKCGFDLCTNFCVKTLSKYYVTVDLLNPLSEFPEFTMLQSEIRFHLAVRARARNHLLYVSSKSLKPYQTACESWSYVR